MLGYVEIVPIWFLKHLIFSTKARSDLQRQNWFSVSQFWISRNLSKNQHVGPSFSEIFCGKKIVWLCAVLVCEESLILRISARKRIFQQHHFSLFQRWAGFVGRKMPKKSCDTANCKHIMKQYTINIPFAGKTVSLIS